MDLARNISLAAAALLIVGGLAAVVTLELSRAERRLVGRFRDIVEVLAPPVLTMVLLAAVWIGF